MYLGEVGHALALTLLAANAKHPCQPDLAWNGPLGLQSDKDSLLDKTLVGVLEF